MAIGSELDILSSLDFQFSNLWDFVIFENPTGINIASILNAGNLQGLYMKFKIVSTTLPLPSLETEELKTGQKRYVGRKFEGDYEIEVLEDSTFSTYGYFYDWMSKIYDFNNNVFLPSPSKYNKAAVLIYYLPTLNVPSAIFTYENLKIKSIGDLSPNRIDSKALTYKVSLTFDKVSFGSYISSVSSLLSQIPVPSVTLPGTGGLF